jgi:hypothetical protein
MSLFNGMALNLNIGKAIAMLSCALFLSACASTRTFEDAGVYQGKHYTISITRVPDNISSEVSYIAINGDQILDFDLRKLGRNWRDENCQHTSTYVNQCTFNTQYEGMAVKVIQEVDGKLYQQNAYYSVYFDGVLIRRVTTPLLL